ncbi:protein of unknown function [Methylocella tundrae]|uniref:Uncharacterized protein n=1 Tax=Methylocella tundrae TaxID=227605 RepID=A0A4U8YWX6_METTU|nr:protein of unknown function [Methylocella tundrae]
MILLTTDFLPPNSFVLAAILVEN